MNTHTTRFNARELSSRKLWHLVRTATDTEVNEQDIREAIAELATRRQHLARLQQSGKLEGQNEGA